jgi:hypothetical protein
MANITKVYLMNTLFEKDYAHTMYFADAAAQQAYFKKRILSKHTYTDFSYQRKDHVIRIPAHVDTLYASKINYCMYQNAQYSNKWFYAFVTDMKYVDDGRTDVYIETDVMQTWMFDITVKHSFVEREHATTDTVGANTVDEGLEIGEYVCGSMAKDSTLDTCQYVLMVSDTYNEELLPKPLAVNMGGIFYAGGAFVCDTMLEVVNIINLYKGKIDAVYAVYMIPKKILNHTGDTMTYEGQKEPTSYTISQTKPTTVNGYTPRNKKLLTYPYVYMLESNNAGSANVLRYEFFSGNPSFEVIGIPVVGGSIKCCPKNYKGVAVNHEEGVMCGKFPTLSWSADLFTNWLTQNSVNIGLGLATSAAQVIGGVATIAGTSGAGAAIGGASVVSGITSIANQLAQVHTQSFTPNSARGNTNGGDINTASDTNTFMFYHMSIKAEYARIIDEFFDMYGYKCHRVKVPAKNHRENYWYTKTIDANIVGGIPQDDLQKIKDCYNRGITFWKTEEYYRNYSVSNDIV